MTAPGRLDAEIDALRSVAYRQVLLASGTMLLALGWGTAAALWPVLATVRLPVGVALLLVAAGTAVAALASAGRPIQRRAGYDAAFMQAVVVFPMLLALGTPLIAIVVFVQDPPGRALAWMLWMLAAIGMAGPITALVLGATRLLTDRLGPVVMGSRYRVREYAGTTLSRGEGKPLGLLGLALGLLYPATVLVVFWGQLFPH